MLFPFCFVLFSLCLFVFFPPFFFFFFTCCCCSSSCSCSSCSFRVVWRLEVCGVCMWVGGVGCGVRAWWWRPCVQSVHVDACVQCSMSDGVWFVSPRMQRCFKHFDANGDGLISYDEFATRLEEVKRSHVSAAGAEDELLRVLQRIASTSGLPSWSAMEQEFKAMDENGTGKLSRGEMRRALQKWGVTLSKEEVEVRGWMGGVVWCGVVWHVVHTRACRRE